MRVALDYEALPPLVDGLRECRTAMDESIDRLESKVKALQSGFRGESAQAYFQAQASWNMAARQLIEYLGGIADFLVATGEGFREREEDHVELL